MGLLGPTVGRVFDRFGSRLLVIPGAVGIVVALTVFTRVGLTTPIWTVLAAHVPLMVSLAAVFTLGPGALPMHLYSHGSSLLGTSQQVAASVGTAIVVTVLSARTTALADAGASPDGATVGGMQWAFGVGAVISLMVLGLAFLLPNRLPAPAPESPVAEPAAVPEPV